MIGRRDMFALAGLVTALGSGSRAQACSLPPNLGRVPKAFFSAIAKRDYELATAQLARSCRLSVITFDKADIFEGHRNIVGTISNLIHAKGFHVFGDARTRPSGGSWAYRAGWLCGDLLRGPTMNLDGSTCGGPGALSDPIFNVKVHKDEADKIDLMVLLDSYEMSLNISKPTW